MAQVDLSLARDELKVVFLIHVGRILASTCLSAVLWHMVLPDTQIGWWLVLATIRLLISRLPFIPNKDVVFAGVAVLALGDDVRLAALMAMMAALIVTTHVLARPRLCRWESRAGRKMKPRVVISLAAAPLLLAATIPSTPDLGKAEARCSADERGPAFLVDVLGLKDRKGRLKLEVYPANDEDFLAYDNLLVSAEKTFRRVEQPVPQAGPVQLCIRVPSAGTYAVTLLHDRNENRKFGWRVDGIGFSGDPRLGWSKPKAVQAVTIAGSATTRVPIVLNYVRGLKLRPLDRSD